MSAKKRAAKSPTATKGATKRKAPAKPATRDERALDEARRIHSRLKANFTAIKKKDAARKVKLYPEPALKAFGDLIRQVSDAMTTHRVQGDKARGGTARERAARLALIAVIKLLRDEIALAYPKDADMKRAFGVGKRLSTTTNEDARALSSDQQKACEDKDLGPKARAAGVTPARVDKLIALRRALIAVSTDQEVSRTEKKGLGADKRDLLRKLRAETARGKKVGRVMFHDSPRIRDEFGGGAKRAKKRKAKPKPPTSGSAAPPGTSGASNAA